MLGGASALLAVLVSPFVYNQSCKVCEDTHLHVPTLLLRGKREPRDCKLQLRGGENPLSESDAVDKVAA